MAADALATHLQSLYIVCGTAIPVLFVALAVQEPSGTTRRLPLVLEISPAPLVAATVSFEVPVSVQRVGLLVMLVGEIASLTALLLDWSSVVPQVVAVAGILAGALFVAASVAPTSSETTSPRPDASEAGVTGR
jgi:hypothetical protein